MADGGEDQGDDRREEAPRLRQLEGDAGRGPSAVIAAPATAEPTAIHW